MLKETEACKKWCPQTQRDPSGALKASSLCVGSSCAAWLSLDHGAGECLMMRAVAAPLVDNTATAPSEPDPAHVEPATVSTRRGKSAEL